MKRFQKPLLEVAFITRTETSTPNGEGYDFDLNLRFRIKNRSSYDSFDIAIEDCKPERQRRFMRTIKRPIPIPPRLEKYGSTDFNIVWPVHVSGEEGLELKTGRIRLPECLSEIRILIGYRNEVGSQYFLRYTKIDNYETNRITSKRPNQI